jgi:hypothetical protein
VSTPLFLKGQGEEKENKEKRGQAELTLGRKRLNLLPKANTTSPPSLNVLFFFCAKKTTPNPRRIGDKGEERFTLKTRHTRMLTMRLPHLSGAAWAYPNAGNLPFC